LSLVVGRGERCLRAALWRCPLATGSIFSAKQGGGGGGGGGGWQETCAPTATHLWGGARVRKNPSGNEVTMREVTGRAAAVRVSVTRETRERGGGDLGKFFASSKGKGGANNTRPWGVQREIGPKTAWAGRRFWRWAMRSLYLAA